jgi:cupin 2 domain-containing protein
VHSNFFAGIPERFPQELFTTLLTEDNLRIERIVSHGQASPVGFWYDQPQHEWVLVISGAALLQIDDQTIELSPGDHVNIPAHTRHRVEWTTPDEPTFWLAVHYGRQR